ncbi:MAG: rRNA pseudouridine synthase [Oscillospiraceae bacterium]|nr:rRNA pseudouridine synthase [Oscillospiraceae bacterium]
MEKIRIQKIIADSGFCSRRKAEEYIEKGLVRVNGREAKTGDKASRDDLITVNREKLEKKKLRNFYYILHKPRGYISTLNDEKDRRCIAELIKEIPHRVFPVGRLDVNSEGMMILTNDGEFANRLSHPSYKIKKSYRVTIRPAISDEQCAALSAGVMVDGKMTAPCAVSVLHKEQGRTVLGIILQEGRNRQIRKMLDSLNIEVARLKRIGFGSLKLGMLKPGEYRELTKSELKMLQENNHSSV